MFEYLVWQLRQTLVWTCTLIMFWFRQVRRVRRTLDVESVKTLHGSFLCHIISRLLQLDTGVCAKEGHRQVATGSEWWSAPDHRNPETRAWSFTAVEWWSALADYPTAGAVQACCNSSSVSSAPSYKLPRRLLRASLRSFRPPTSPFGQPSQTEIPPFRRSTFGTRAFSVAGLKVWNSLPDSLRDPAVESSFRRGTWKRISAGH